MSFPFTFPVDKGTADAALAKFNDFASNIKFKGVFEEALRISFGSHYSITLDHSMRMNFFCEPCRKTLNCITALMSHHSCGHHIKNVDMQARSTMEESMISLASHFPRNSFQYALACSQAPILGAHLIEGYAPHRRKSVATYFKCLLCGAHGNAEGMLRHVKNDKHTDRYIKYNFQCNLSTFTPEIRESIRKQVFAEEGVAIRDIKTIKDRERYLYPTRWEDEGLSKEKLLNKYTRHKGQRLGRFNSSPASCTSPHSRSRGSGHASHQHLGMKGTPLHDRAESPLAVVIKQDCDVSKSDQGVQMYTDWAFKRCLKKLSFIVHTHGLEESDVTSQEDAQACIELMFSTGALLQHSLYSAKDRCSDHQGRKTIASMLENVDKMQTYVKSIFSEHWNAANAPGDCLGETLALWNLKSMGLEIARRQT